MTKLTNATVFKTHKPQKETPMDKTTRAVREILEGEAEKSQVKTARLRKARLEREASTPVEAITKTSKGASKKPRD